MKNFKFIAFFALILFAFVGCDDDTRDITGDTTTTTTSTEVNPVDINTDGFDFLEKMQGHWVGSNLVMTTDYTWFGWDFRAISPSHLHGIHEGGTQGNLLTSFFVSNYKNTRTIMARNGGVLNSIYRTSYFVMDKVEDRGTDGKYYRFVDAIGGEATMSFELRFVDNKLYFNVYTSNLGTREPTRHMTFVANKMHTELATAAAQATGFPQNTVDDGLDFSNGFNTEYLYTQKSATFLAQGTSNDVYGLAPQSGDPYTITDHPRLGTLKVNLTRGSDIATDKLLVYLSRDALTDTNGYLTSDTDAYDTILHFPELENNETEFLFTYLHPGNYYLTVVADKNNDGSPSTGDITSVSQLVTIDPLENKVVEVTNINVQN